MGQEKTIELKCVPPAYTSQAKHLGCEVTPAGILRRDPTDKDTEKCLSCGEIENIHSHAARIIYNRRYKQSIGDPDKKIYSKSRYSPTIDEIKKLN